MFPTWPAKSELATMKKEKVKEKSPTAPEGGAFHQSQVMVTYKFMCFHSLHDFL